MPLNPHILKAAKDQTKQADMTGTVGPVNQSFNPGFKQGPSIGRQHNPVMGGYTGAARPVQPAMPAQPPPQPAMPAGLSMQPIPAALDKISTVREFFKRAASLVTKFADAGGMGSMPASGVPTGPPDNAPNRISPAPAPQPMGITTSQGAVVPPGPAPMKLQMPQKQQ